MNKVAACNANSETIAMCSYVIINHLIIRSKGTILRRLTAQSFCVDAVKRGLQHIGFSLPMVEPLVDFVEFVFGFV